MISLPMHTERLLLRMATTEDLPTIAAYRNDPEVARYQDWPLPYTLDDAVEGFRRVADLDGPAVGRSVNVMIEHEGEVVGDVFVGIGDEHPGGAVAFLGYTLATRHQGKGFASEAASAMVDAVFEHTPVHRIVATLDPENTASMRLLEQLGFTFEGLARQAEPIRGEWLDDMRFGLLRDDRAAWRARPRSCEHVALVEVTPDNLRAVLALETHRFQRRFVAPMEASLAQALVPEIVKDGVAAVPWYRAIEADGEIVGFVMVADVSPVEPFPFLWRLLIDRRHQRRGVGAKAIAALVEHVRARGHRALGVSWVDAPGGPRPFYERLGFVPTGEFDDDEVIARLDL
ncbi:MAG: N-acetyltransferase [Acidimicrobiales bacterium]|nr:N-acetyltransferase [Acidimicrobiales bacterium]MCB9394046.1 N-acetyltransferase [Acidimicrobiaceae bacterium]